jgi:stage II sporulation protein AA (anti-sigma F factor antagonist)
LNFPTIFLLRFSFAAGGVFRRNACAKHSMIGTDKRSDGKEGPEMPVELQSEDRRRLTAILRGEIDHHSASVLRDQIDEAIIRLRPPRLRLDFAQVTFMDSSAVGLVMGRYRAIAACQGELEVINLSPFALRMMKLAGLQALASLRGKPETQGGTEQ